MKEQIEKDRETIRNKTTKDETFSYLPFLQSQKTSKTTVKLSKLSTLNILVYLEEGFQRNDKHMLNNLERIKKEVLQRGDLFEAILQYLENKRVRDDLFYWTPGHKISNIFCFIVSVAPNFIQLYKDYYIEKIVCGRVFYDASNFIRERYSADYEQFKLMEMDLTLFKKCISAQTWTGETTVLKPGQIEILEKLEIPRFIDISSDIEASIVPLASFIDLEINGRKITVRLDRLIGLIEKDEKHRKYWGGEGVDISDFTNFS